METFKPVFLTKADMAQVYSDYKPHFDLLLTRLLDYLQSILALGNSLTYKARVKSFESYYKKIQKFKIKSVGHEMPLLTDILGIRIMCTFISNLEEVKNILSKNFELYDVENKGDQIINLLAMNLSILSSMYQIALRLDSRFLMG